MLKAQTPAFDASRTIAAATASVLSDREKIASMCTVDYIISIDGGGSKTLLQVLNSKMMPIELHYEGFTDESLVFGAGNINNVGLSAVKQMLEDALTGVKIGPQKLSLKDIDNKAIVCGLAGLVSNADNRLAINEIFTSVGFEQSRIYLSSDVDLAKQLIDEQGAILISGTGSICFSKTSGKEKRLGGFGYALGDEGSGFYVGKLALQAAFRAKFEQEEPFALTEKLCAVFNVAAINEVIKLFYSGALKPADIAKVTPLVFDAAFKQDEAICKEIINSCATELAKLITRAVKGCNMTDYPVYLIGGLFKNENADLFIEMIRQKVSYSEGLKFINISNENIAVQIVLSQSKIAQTSKLNFLV